MATINDLAKQLANNNASNIGGHQATSVKLDTLNKSFNSFFNYIKKGDLDKLEAMREGKGKAASVKPVAAAGAATGTPMLPLGLNIPSLIAGIAAIAGAFAGLRGWEAKALKNIDKLGKALRSLIPKSFRDDLTKALNQKFIDLRASILRVFGLDDTLKKFNDPDSGLKRPIGQQLMERFSKFRTRILNTFGIGADGKPIVVQGKDGKFKVPTITRITEAIETLFKPVMFFVEGVGKALKAGAIPVIGLLKGLGVAGLGVGGKVTGMLGAIGKLAGKILFPLGILFSAKAAWDEWSSSPEGMPLSEKLTKTAFAFVADFIGAPLDLLTKGINFLYTKAFGLEVGEDGKFTGSSLAAKFGNLFKGFSFEEAIKAIPDMFMKLFDAISAFFDDPVGVGKQVVGKLLDSIKEALMGIVRGLVGFMPDFAKKQVLGEEGFARYKAEEELEDAQRDLIIKSKALEKIPGQQMNLQRLRDKLAQQVDSGRSRLADRTRTKITSQTNEIEQARIAYQEALKRQEMATNQLAQIIDGSTTNNSAPQAFAMGPTSAFDTSDQMMMEAYGAR